MYFNKTITMTYAVLRVVMILFWIYVGMDKIWQLGAFKIALTQQPVIRYLAPILYWFLPLLEISLGILLAIPSQKVQSLAWKASTLLIALFTVYIGLGVLDIYAQKPCMCSSFLNNVSWTTHLWINIMILGLSILGWLLNASSLRKSGNLHLTGGTSIALLLITIFALSAYHYKKTSGTTTKYHWYTPDSLHYAPEYNTVMSLSKGLLASTYDRYLEPYRQLFTKGLQTSTTTNQLLVCNTERRIAIC